MTHDNLTYDDLVRIVELIKSSEQFSEFRLKIGEVEIELRRRDASLPGSPPPAPVPPRASEPVRDATAAPSGTQRSEPAAMPVTPPAPAAPVQWPEHFIVTRSPMMGTFYRAPEPGAPPFVRIGDTVAPDTVLCIIEVMKLMNSIPAATHGVVRHILVDDAQAVEAQQALIVIEPAG